MTRREYIATTYARTDHDDGDRSWDEITRQQHSCSASAGRLAIRVVANFYDIGEPGTKTHRPGLRDLLARAERQPLDYAVVSSIDRLADRAEQLQYLLMRLRNLGVNVLMADHDTVIELVLPSDLEVLHGGDDEQS